MANNKIDFEGIAAAALNVALNLLHGWLPAGKLEGHEFKAPNPTRADRKAGSFSININTGVWSDFATDDSGRDLISLYAYLHGMDQGAAARAVAALLHLDVVPAAPVSAAATALPPEPETPPEWEWVAEVPDGAPDMHLAHVKRGRPERVAVYKSRAGRVMGAVMRFRTSGGGKDDIPHTLWRHVASGRLEWKWRGFPVPRPLYGLEGLANPAAQILIVEGEKCRDAAAEFFADRANLVVMSWPGGCKAVEKADWSGIVNRTVCLWPDADSQRVPLTREQAAAGVDPDSQPYLPGREQPGAAAMLKIAAILKEQGCFVHWVALPPPGTWPDGYDIADAIADGGALVVDVAEVVDDARDCPPVLPDAAAPVPPVPTTVALAEDCPAGDDLPPVLDDGDLAPVADAGDAGGEWQDAVLWALENLARIDGCERFFCIPLSASWGKRVVLSRLGEQAYRAWLAHPELKDWPKARADLAVERKKAEVIADDPIFKGDFSRFVLIYGESEIIDLQKMGYRGDNGRMTAAAFRNAVGKDRSDVWLNSDSPKKLKVMRPDLGFFPFEPFGVSRCANGDIDSDKDGFVKMISTYNGLPFKFQPSSNDAATAGKSLKELCFSFEFEGCRRIIDVLRSLCNDDDRAFEWILNWMACRVRYPTRKQATALVVASPVQGAGKSLIFDKLMGRIFGKYAGTLNQTAMESNFTGDYDEKMYICYEEVSSQKARFDLAGRIKDQITSDHIRIERKGQDAVYQKNFIGFVYLSNYRSPVVVEKNDRRFFVIAPEKAITKTLGGQVNEDIFNDDVVQEFVNLLYSLPLTYTDEAGVVCEFGSHTPAYDTPAKTAMKAWNSSPHETFVAEWLRGDLKLPVVCCELDDFYDVFLHWASRNREKNIAKSRFRALIDNYEQIVVKRTNNAIGSKAVYVVPPPEVMHGPSGLPDAGSVSSGKYYDAHATAFVTAAHGMGYLHKK